MVDRRLPKSRRISIYSFVCPRNIDGRKTATAFPPMVAALRAFSPNYSQSLWPTFGCWLLCFPIQRKPSKLMAPSSLSFNFFRRSIQPPKTTSKHPPPPVPPVRISSPTSPPLWKPSFGWLLHRPIEYQPPKLDTLRRGSSMAQIQMAEWDRPMERPTPNNTG